MALRTMPPSRVAGPGGVGEGVAGDYGKPTLQPGSYLHEVSPSGQVSRFRVGRILGRGGFAKCYEVSDVTGSYALKVINRQSLDKPKTLQKLQSEIAIHHRMKHKYIVNFIRTFKDRYNVYILLEKCDNGTLMDMLKVRPLSVPETQFIMIQCLAAMQYMHDQRVIHRDLKPGNIMLDGDMNIKIGDFGLAAELQYDGDRKRTVCGTPNYIAPEIIDKRSHGHSYEVDTWSLGVIVYTLLTGQPPFQMEDVESTYNRIRQCRYDFPSSVPESARDLIRQILQSSPSHRPTLIDIRSHPFFSSPTPPTTAPASFASFGITPGGSHQRRAAAPVTAAMEPPPYMNVPATNRVSYHPNNAKEAQPLREREALRPISANVPPPHGVPTSPRALQSRDAHVMVPPTGAGATTGGNHRAYNFVQPAALPTLNPRRSSPEAERGPNPKPTDAHAYPHVYARSSAERDRRVTPPDNEESPRRAATTQQRPPPPRMHERPVTDEEEDRQQFTVLHDQLEQTLNGVLEPGVPAALPVPQVWVTECADFSAKYGMCYKLSTGHTGAHFNDSTKMAWQPVTGRVEYYDRVKVEMPNELGEMVVYARDKLETFNMGEHRDALEKKITLIKYFKSYLGRPRSSRDKAEVVRCSQYESPMPSRLSDPHVSEDFVYVKRWLRVPEALIFRLSNKTVQVCFDDKAEVILSSEWRVVTYTDPNGCRRTLDLNVASSESEETANRLRHTRRILYQLVKDQHL